MASATTFEQPKVGLRRAKTWTLDDTKLTWRTSAEQGETPLAEITGVTVQYAPSVQAGLPATRNCLIDIRGQKRQVVLIQEENTNADIPLRAAYAAFVRDLMARTVAQNPSVALASGNILFRIFWILLLAAMVAGIAFLLFKMVSDQNVSLELSIVVFALASAIYPVSRQIRSSGATTFDLANMPVEIVGG